MIGTSSGNPNEDLYSYLLVNLPTYPLIYPLEPDTQNLDINQNEDDNLEE